MTAKTPQRLYSTPNGDQIVMVGEYAYVWSQHQVPLEVGELVLTTHDDETHEVTELGTVLGGAIGFVRGRVGVSH